MSAATDPIRLGREDWFRRVGEVASSVGTDRFHQQLIELFGSTIPHSSSWIIRYSRVAPPDVIYTWNVPQDVVDFYAASCASLDPFSAHWKRYEEPGVRTLAGFGRDGEAEVDAKPYNRLFKAAAKITDELGVFFSTVGNSSLGLFLEREKGRFTEAEIARTKLVFPVLDGFHKTHIGRIFDRLRFAGEANETQLAGRPTLVLDRHGLEIFANAGWRQAVAEDPAILDVVASAQGERQIALPDFLLKIERFDRYFPLAPSGVMFVLAPKPEPGAEPPPERPASAVPQGLTAREREVFDLMMAGRTTGAVAQALGISKGAVKNLRLRIYRKADVSSERALVQRFGRPVG